MGESPLVVDTPEEAAALDRPPLLVRRPLEAILDAAGIGTGPLDAEMIGDGHSNITYLVRREGAEVVLRRPPRPPLPPSAHDVVREARLLQALEGHAVRTPRVLLLHEDAAPLGVPFYVMAFERGDVLGQELPARFADPGDPARIGDELVDALVELHAVDWRAAGLDWFGKGDDRYLERQLRRFGGIWDATRTRDVPEVEEAAAWLAAHRPRQRESTLVHGDYRLGNVLFAPDPAPRLGAIFDWELSTIGDPLADLGYLTATYATADGPQSPLAELSTVTARPGFPDRAGLVARYAERSGRDVGDIRWYEALASWKAAVFLEASYARHLAGTTDDPYFARLGEVVPALGRLALQAAEGTTA
ncbi:phosphotransferase family protein [Patulibacter sp. SYSU D01012]|uniref:phosphotransferase family protein n=1 Tax=Patulibacter sp. SYSU D01012 TaxID=2817381 RepID=UPI001B316AB5|nr:phosphotransferase family protein [Patulibacter sp. SYSU D01012]